MPTAPTRLLTADEFWEFLIRDGDEDTHYELREGRVTERPLEGQRHGFVCANGCYILWNYLKEGRPGYVCSSNTALLTAKAPDSVLCPDLMLFPKTVRLEDMGDKYADDVPSLVVEVLSDIDTLDDRPRRVAQYLDRGVPLVWEVDVDRRSVIVHRPKQHSTELGGDEFLICDDPLPEFRSRVADFFVATRRRG